MLSICNTELVNKSFIPNIMTSEASVVDNIDSWKALCWNNNSLMISIKQTVVWRKRNEIKTKWYTVCVFEEKRMKSKPNDFPSVNILLMHPSPYQNSSTNFRCYWHGNEAMKQISSLFTEHKLSFSRLCLSACSWRGVPMWPLGTCSNFSTWEPPGKLSFDWKAFLFYETIEST